MKKKSLKNLALKKTVVSRLDQKTADQIQGGETICSCASCPGPSQSLKEPCLTVCNV